MTPEAKAIQLLLSIPNKQGVQVPFNLNPSQLAYDSCRTNRDIITKARQKGFSSFGVAIQTIKCLGIPGTRAVLISHEAGATQRLLDKAQYYLKYIKGPKPELGRHSRNELYFPKTESTYYIGTAGSKAFGRGDTITDLHISEYAWWETDGLKHVAGLMQAVPTTGCIRIESTGNGMNNDFYYMSTHSQQLGYNLFFRSWHDDDEYQLPLPSTSWEPVGFENYFQDMQTKYNLKPEQLFWYWMKLCEFRQDLKWMQQEYPSNIDECFQATGGQVFPDAKRQETQEWKWKVEDGRRIEYLSGHPRPGWHYVIGSDPSGGTGNDEAAYIVLCLETCEEVEEFGNSGINPVDFGLLLAKVGKKYNEAFQVCESNNHGIATHSVLLKVYPHQKIYKRHLPVHGGKIKYGFHTTEDTKCELVGAINTTFDTGLVLHGTTLVQEMKAFSEDPKTGQLGAKSDNRVIALGLACIGYIRYERFKSIDLPKREKKVYQPGSGMIIRFDEVLKNIEEQRQRKMGYFPNQLASRIN